jgi:hypothetical protein
MGLQGVDHGQLTALASGEVEEGDLRSGPCLAHSASSRCLIWS